MHVCSGDNGVPSRCVNLHLADTDFAEMVGNPYGSAAHLPRIGRVGADRRNTQQTLQFVDEPGFVLRSVGKRIGNGHRQSHGEAVRLKKRVIHEWVHMVAMCVYCASTRLRSSVIRYVRTTMILDNPFHVLGLPADCTPREFATRSSRIKAYLNVGKPLVFEDDLYFAGCHRNATTVQNAHAALQSAQQKLRSGLFWFTRSGRLDAKTLDLISKGHLVEAYELLARIENRSAISSHYISSVNNFGTLCLLMAMTKQRPPNQPASIYRTSLVLTGLSMKAKIIGMTNPDDFQAWCASISDDVAARDLEGVVNEFGTALHLLVEEVRKYGVGLGASDLVPGAERWRRSVRTAEKTLCLQQPQKHRGRHSAV